MKKRNLMFLFFFLGYAALSAQMTAEGVETKANNTTTNSQQRPDLATDSLGNYIIVWESFGTDGDGWGVYGQRYTSAGVASGSEFLINTTTTNDQRSPSVSMDASGNFAVVWMSEEQDGSGWGVYLQRFNSAGASQGSETLVNTTTTGHQRNASVAQNYNGDILVCWSEVDLNGTTFTVKGQRYNSSGIAQGSEFQLNSSSVSSIAYPQAAVAYNGDFVAVWQTPGLDGSGMGVYARRYNSSGVAQGNDFLVNTTTTNNQQAPDVACDSAGNFKVVWQSYAQDLSREGIYAKLYNADGSLAKDEFLVNTTTSEVQEWPSISSTQDGLFAVSWTDNTKDLSYAGVYAQLYEANGDAVGTETLINTNTTNFQQFGKTAMSAADQLTVAWQDGQVNSASTNDGDDYGVYFQRFSLVVPLVLTLDSIDVLCNGGATGSATSNVSGGSTPYTYTWSNGGTTANISSIVAGTYTLTVTDAAASTITASIIVNEPTALSATASVDNNATCNGQSDGGATAAATGGTAPYTYAWSNGATTASITSVSAGTYTVTITDNNACTATDNTTITEPTALVASANTTSNATCNGQSDGAATASGSGGTAPYTYAWSNGATTASISSVSAGTYTVTITDNNACTATDNTTITEPTALTASANTTSNASCNGLSDGSATANGSGGTSPYTYAWSNGATTASISSVSAGTYTVTITDNNGCTNSDNTTITEPTAVVVIASTSGNVNCNGGGDGSAASSASGGTSPYTYVWSNGATTANITSVSAGTYTVTVTDNNGCTDTDNTTVTEPAALGATASVDNNATCNGQSDGGATAAATGGTAPYTYAWSNGATTASITSVSAGTYTVTITDNNACTATDNTTITEPTALTASANTTSNATCNGQSDGAATASGSGGTSPYTYAWSNGATTASITSVSAGTYTVTVTDNNGCTTTDNTTITEPTALTASANTTSNATCNGQSDGAATASGSGGTSPYTYAWSNGATTASISSVSAGTYTVTIIDNNGCTDTDNTTITEPTVLIASANTTSNATCNGQSDGAATASGSGGTSPYTYAWSNGATTANITSVSAGTYTVTITDNNGCTDTDNTTITEPAALSATASVDNNATCNGQSDGGATAAAAGGTAPYTYAWSNGATTASISSVSAGTYTVTITDNNACTATDNTTITEPTALVASASTTSNATCNGQSDGAATASGSGGTSPYTYAWSNGATTASISSVSAGTYTVTITDNNACTATDNTTITEPTALTASANTTSNASCNGLSDGAATANGSGGTSPYTYAWSNGATTASISSVSAGTYTVTITDNNACTATDNITITEPTVLIASANTTSNATCNGQSDGAATASGSGGTSPYTYAWSNGATTASITSVSAGTYTVTITDNNGCTDTDNTTITEPVVLIASANTTSNVSCNGLSDGAATASGTGGTVPYTYSWSNGATTASITGLSAGTYTVTVTDNNACTDIDNVSITEPAALGASISASTNVSCNGGSDGAATASGSGGTSPYTYTWSNGATTASISSVSAGTYTVTVTDNNACSNTANITITEPTVLSASISATNNVTCNGLNDGAATASGSGGTSPYTYTWSNGATTANITSVVAGTYTVTITDANGCTSTDNTSITEPTSFTALISSSSNVSCNGLSDGTATASGSGGTSPYTYTWSNSATTATTSGLIAGSYTVTITDNNGCSDTENILITEPTALFVSTVVDSNVSVNGLSDGGATASGSGGTSPYTYTWSNSATTASITGLAVGTYTVTLTDNNGCTATNTATIAQPASLLLNISIDSNVSCNGLSDGGASVSVSGGTSPYTYAWSNAATTASISGVVAGTYTVTVTDNNGGTATVNGVITEPSLLIASTTIDSTVSCNGLSDGGATASATGGTAPYTYSWSNGATTTSITGVSAGIYIVTVSDNNACTSTQNATITEPSPLVTVVVVDSNVSINGQSDGGASATASGGSSPYTYSWSNGATVASISGVAAGTYTLTLSDANGCTATGSANISEPTVLMISTVVDSNVSCNGLSNGGATASVSGGVSPYTYVWSNSATTASISGVMAGTYTVTVSDNNGATATTTAAITEPVALLASTVVDSNVSCNGLSDGGATVAATGGTAPYTYTWSNAATTASITGVAAGSYTVTVSDANGCTTSDVAVITEPTTLVATAVVDSNVSCNGLSDGGATASTTGGTAPYTYSWSNGAITASITGVAAGSYTVTVSDVNGCTATDNASISEPTLLQLTTVVDSNVSVNGLSDGGATASGTGGTIPYTYAWSNGATTASITGVAAGIYTVTLTDNNGCTEVDNVIISEPGTVLSTITVDSNVSCNGLSDGGLTANVSGGVSPYTYTWSNAATTASLTALVAGTYTVTVTDNNGGTATASGTITEPTLLISNTVVDSNASCNGLSNGGASTSASGGTAPYTYAWSNGATVASISGVAAGAYTVTISDANGCSNVDNANISEPAMLLAATVVDSNVSCNGLSDGGTTASASGGTSPYTYAWSNGATTASITGVAAGSYTISVSDANGCTASDNVLITEPVVLQSTTVIAACSTYTWPLNSKVYTITGLYSDTVPSLGGCDSIVTLDLSIDTVNVGLSQNGFTLTANQAGATYQWLEDCGTSNTQIPGATAQSYTVTVNGSYSVVVSYNSCVDTSACINVTNVGIENPAIERNFRIYPNPTKKTFIVELSNNNRNERLQIFDFAGNLVKEKQLEGTKEVVDVSTFAVGVYMIKYGNRVEKLIVTR